MITLKCSRCGTAYTFTDGEVNLMLASGVLYVDCINCANEIALEPDA